MTVPDWPDDLIVRTLRAYGEWSLAEQMLLSPMLRQTDALWDVGAFLGTFGLGVAQLASKPPRRIVVLEPSTILLPYLQDNLTRNAPCPFLIAPYAVGQEVARLRLRADQDDRNAGAQSYETANAAEEGLLGRSLRDLRAEYGDYDVLKLDIEGMENEAILGDIDYVQRSSPLIWAECNEHEASIALLESLVWLKYQPLYVAFPFFRKENTNRSSERIFPMAYEAALLAAPLDRLADFVGKVDGEEIIVRPVTTPDDLRQALWSTPRWAAPEWIELSREELIGLLGHQTLYGDLTKFLIDDVQTVS